MSLANTEKQDRPRERLHRYGASRLRDAELLALILGSGTAGSSVLELSRRVLRDCKEKGIHTVTVTELMKIKGIGEAKACEIVACFELGRRFLVGERHSILLSPKDVWERMEDIRSHMREHFVVFFLDSRSKEILREVISVGTLNESLVHPREVFEQAIKQNAASIIVAHNHPSGDCEPSSADIEVTKKLVRAGKVLDIEVVDHVIVTKTAWKSILTPLHE